MASRNSSSSGRWFAGHTRLVTVLSIAAVGLAGATAVGANIGILDSASDSPVGKASMTGEPTTSPTRIVAADRSVVAGEIQQFAVDVAGTVALVSSDSELRLEDVFPATGWTWTLVQSSENALQIIFTDGNRTLEFSATAASDGTLSTFVGEPVNTPASTVCESQEVEDDELDDDTEYEDMEADEEYEGLCDDD